MANILVNIEKGIEVGAEDLLGFLNKAEQKIQVAPGAVVALGVVLGGVQKVIADVEADAANPVNITLLPAQVADLKAVWPEIISFASVLGIKL
jgi:hypothetical protein